MRQTRWVTVASFHLAYFPLPRTISRLLVVQAERWEVTEAEGCIMGKVMGTSKEGTTKTSVDIRRWALFAVWKSVEDRDKFIAESALMNRWRANARTLKNYSLELISSHGTWGGIDPFNGVEGARNTTGDIAVMTRAGVRWRKIPTFTRAVNPVDEDLYKRSDCKFALGMGEWPFGEQATFSIWDSSDAIRAFAYDSAAHTEVIRRRADENWYHEEMFSRFAITEL